MRGAGCCFFVLFFLQRSSMDASRDPLICHRISAFTQLSMTLYGGKENNSGVAAVVVVIIIALHGGG